MVRWSGGTVAATLLLAAACGDSSGEGAGPPPDVEVIEGVDGPSTNMVAVGDLLLATPSGTSEGVDGTSAALYRSEDGGRTWSPVGLPGAPERLHLGLDQPAVVGDVVVVTGRAMDESEGVSVPGGTAYVWTSADGREWRGGAFVEGGMRPFAQVDVHAAADVLVAGLEMGGDLIDEPSTYRLYRSEDGGGSWAPAHVPADLTIEPGGQMSLVDVWEVDGGRLVADLGLGQIVTAPSAGASGPTTTGFSGDVGAPPEVVVVGPGDSPAGTQPPSNERPTGTPAVLASDDGGATWRLAPCPDDAAYSPEGCQRPEAYGDLRVRKQISERQVSVDGGATWHDLVTDAPRDDLRIRSVVELDAGGWLATATWDEASDTSEGYLLRSTDGLHWEHLRPASLPPCESSRPNTGFTDPVAFGDGWLTAYHCRDLITPQLSEVFVLDADGTDVSPVPGTRRTVVEYRTALVAEGEGVVVAERDGSADVDIVRLTP
jgi:hypothetical protein